MQENDTLYINALRSNNPEEIAKAPLPSNFTPELMYQTLLGIQNQPSALDRFLDTLMDRFERRQFQKLLLDWNQYLDTAGLTQDAYLRRITERLNIPLEGKKTGKTLDADIAEQELRAEKARQEQAALSRPTPEPARQRTPEEELDDEEERWSRRQAWLLEHGFSDTSERYQQELNVHEDIVRQIYNRMRRRS